jgi:outer membrane protein TolC
VRLSLKEAVDWAVQKNLDLVVEELNRDIAGRQLIIARATFDPFFNLSTTYAKNRDPSASFFEFFNPVTGTTSLTSGVIANPSDTTNFQTGIHGLSPLGTNYQLTFTESRFDNPKAGFLAFNPRYSSRAQVTATQPLLKNAWPAVNLANVNIARNNILLSQEQVELVAINTVYAVESAYWELVFTLKNFDSKSRALEISREQLRIDQKKLEVGTKARIDVTTSESQVARRKTEYDQAAALVEDARDRLLDRMNYVGLEESLKGRWQRQGPETKYVHYGDLMVVPTTEPDSQEIRVDRSDSVRTAFERRVEYSQMELRIKNQDLAISVAKNQLLPDLSLTASWSQLGLDQSFGRANDRLFDGDFYDWSVGGFFEIPLSLRGPRANLRNAVSVREQLQVQRQNLENAIVLEVDKAIRDLQFSFQAVQNLIQVVSLQEELLRAERVKLEVGKSIAYTVATIENDLIAAQTLQLRAKADYEIAKLSFQRAVGNLLRKWGIDLGR